MNKILAIDDKEDNLITISALLKSFLPDCTVITALSGQEGLDKAGQDGPDVIILDVKMPGMDGFEVCRLLKEDKATGHIPVILLTAIKTDMKSRIQGLEIGADAFLTKPIDEAELVAQIKAMLRIKQAEDMLRREKDLLEEMVEERTLDLIESERKLIKERDFIRSLEDASPAYYVALDNEGRVLTMNRSFLQALDLTLEEVRDRDFFDSHVPEDERPLHRHTFEDIKNSGREMVSESRVLTGKGGELLVEWHGRPFHIKDGKLEFVFYVGIDITERKRLEKIILSNAELERHKVGQQLHDRLGQNLAGLAFKSEILRLKLKDLPVGDLSDMEDIIAMVNDAIGQTRDLARDLCPVDMAAGGLAAAFDELRMHAEKNRGVACLLNLDDDIDLIADLEASNLYYIAREAVDNAVTHGRARNIMITLNSDDNMISLKIIDDGVGLPDSFEEAAGVGIGIMRYRAWIIGASFSVARNRGGGTVVTCMLKKQGAEAVPEIDQSAVNKYMVETTDRGAGILIVDDHPIVRQGLTQIINLEDDMHVCGEARNSEETIKLISKLNPHLVVTDISIDGASGLDLIKALKNRFAGLPVLVLSIYDELIYAERSIRAGARGYVMKQEAPQVVVSAIRTVLQGKQYLSARVTENLISRMPYDGNGEARSSLDCLTIREFEVFQFVGHGLGNKQIAEKLNISVKTVENYRDRIKNKLNCESSSEMAQFAVQWVIDHSSR